MSSSFELQQAKPFTASCDGRVEPHRSESTNHIPETNRLTILFKDSKKTHKHAKGDQHRINMPRETEPSLNERSFVLQALRENIRLDGRALDAFRHMELSFGDEYGVADVRLGKTR